MFAEVLLCLVKHRTYIGRMNLELTDEEATRSISS